VKRILPILALAFLACAFFVFQGPWFTKFWRSCLVVSVPMVNADALIVLGGEPVARPVEAARLFKQGVAPRVFVSGVGDAAKNRRVLLEAGVPQENIIVEGKASTTYLNAKLLRPLLEKEHIRTALIVTSPFHTRRALATFRKLIPGVSFGVVDASIDWWKFPEGRGDLNRFAFVEFLKTVEYWFFYGISPYSVGVAGRG